MGVRREPEGVRRTLLLRERRHLRALLDERPDDAARDQSDGHAEADQRRELRPAQHEIRDENLRPDEHQHQRERILQIMEAMHHRRQREIKRAEAKRSEEHTSELQSLMRISYAVFCLNKKKKTTHI